MNQELNSVDKISPVVKGHFLSVLEMFNKVNKEELDKIIEIQTNTLVSDEDKDTFKILVSILTHTKDMIDEIGKDIRILNMKQEDDNSIIFTIGFKGLITTLIDANVVDLILNELSTGKDKDTIKNIIYGLIIFRLPEPKSDGENVKVVRLLIIEELKKGKEKILNGFITAMKKYINTL